MAANKPIPLAQRFAAKWMPEPNSGCWLWTGAARIFGRDARPLIQQNGKPAIAYRVSYELHRGPIPAGMHVCHKCDVPICVNPDHLFLGTQTENMADMYAKGRHIYGQKHPAAKLTPDAVRSIRTDTRYAYEIAPEYGVTPSLINQIKRREIWRHVAAFLVGAACLLASFPSIGADQQFQIVLFQAPQANEQPNQQRIFVISEAYATKDECLQVLRSVRIKAPKAKARCLPKED